MGIIWRLFPKWSERMRQASLAAALIDFVQRLHAGAIFKTGLEREMAGKIDRGEPSTHFRNNAIDLPMHAQLFVINMILESCCEMGVEDADRVLRIIGYVMRRTHPVGPAEAKALAFFGAQWCGAVAADLETVGGGAAPQSGETDRAVYLASREAALRFCGAFGTHSGQPTDAEVATFASLCAQPNSAG